MAAGQMCEADNTLPDGTSNYDINNCIAGYDVWVYNCPTPAPPPTPACWYVGQRVEIIPDSRYYYQNYQDTHLHCATLTTDVCGGQGYVTVVFDDNGYMNSYEYGDLQLCTVQPCLPDSNDLCDFYLYHGACFEAASTSTSRRRRWGALAADECQTTCHQQLGCSLAPTPSPTPAPTIRYI